MSYDSVFGQFMHDVFGALDMCIFSFFGSMQNDFFTIFAKVFTCFGQTLFIYLFLGMCLFLLLFKKTRKIAFMLLVGLGLFVIINDLILKAVTVRLRPYNALQWNSDFFNWYMNAGAMPESPYCFASGHTIFTVCSAIIFYMWAKKDLGKPEAILIFIIPLFTACSRIYLMLHYPTDVIVGILQGVLYAIAAWYSVKIITFIWNKIPDCKFKNYSVDLQPWIEKKIKREFVPGNVSAIIVVVLMVFFAITCTKLFVNNAHPQHCAHQGPDYICMNEPTAKVFNEKTNNWEEYCRIHK